MMIEPLITRHWPKVKAIYEAGIATGNATFATTVPDWADWDHSHVKTCRLVAMQDNEVAGWAALTAITDQCTFAGVAEVSIYVAEHLRGRGIGKHLLRALLGESEANNFWMLEARILAENTASIKIHEECGFRVVGVRERIAKLNDVWRDTVLLERRSIKVGL